MSKEKVELKKTVMLIDTNTQYFDMQEIENRRFMYNPQTGHLVLGFQFSGGGMKYSHAEEHARSKAADTFDSMVRGWVGSGKQFKDGVIHFSPNISSRYKTLFNRGFDTLEMFRKNNANGKTVVRGFGNTWEQSLENIFTERQVDLMADKPNMQQAAASTKEPPKAPSVTPIVLEGKTQKDKLQEITEKLQQGVKDIFSSDKYKEYLNVMSKFHHYSFRNTMLILMQKPDASMLAGYGAWGTKFKRQVKRGEKGIKIIAPTPYKTQKEIPLLDQKTKQPIFRPDGTPLMQTVDVTIPAYKVTTVFDVSQTHGEPLPSLGVDELTGNVNNYKNFFAALESVSPVPIGFEQIPSGAKGYFSGAEQRIAIQENMSELQTVKTAIHEIAHAKLHNITPEEAENLEPEERKDRNTREVEAESVAYTVCQHYGIDTADYTFGYVAGWSSSKEAPELSASLSTIQKTANEIIRGIDERLAELTQEQTAKMDVDLNTNVGQWYRNEFPSDELGNEINSNISFEQLFDRLPDTHIYSMLGVQDSVVRERCFSKLAELKQVDYSEIYDRWEKAEIPHMLNPENQPVLTVIWSESPDMVSGERLPLFSADKAFEILDRENPESGFYKTKFAIDFMYKGELCHYEGRQDIGVGDGGVIDHIKKYHGDYRRDVEYQTRLAGMGAEHQQSENERLDYLLNEIVPCFEMHCNLSNLEHITNDMMLKKDNITNEEQAYYTAVLDYVSVCRNELNTGNGELKFPELPQRSDFIKEPAQQAEEQPKAENPMESTAPTVDELEEKAKSGEPISVLELADAAKAEKQRGGEKKQLAKKPSIKKQLAEEKKKAAEKPKKSAPAKKKSKDLEVS